MIPPDTTSKESTDAMPPDAEPQRQDQASSSDVSQPPRNQSQETRTEMVPDKSALGVTARVGHAVRVKDLNAYYGTNRTVKDVTIDFPPNEATALIGPSGSGKSTVVRCINRMH